MTAYRRHCLSVLSLALMLAVAPTLSAEDLAGDSSGRPRVRFDAEAGTLSIVAANVELHDLLAEIERQSGLAVAIVGRLERRLSVRLTDLSTPRALRQILRGENYVLRHPTLLHRGRRPGRGSLWLYPEGKGAEVIVAGEASRCAPGTRCGDDRHREETPRAREEDVLAALDDPDVLGALDRLAEAALGDPRASVRLDAVYGLGELGDAAAVTALEGALDDPDLHVRREAVAALTDIGGQSAAWAMVPALNATDIRLREEAVYALGEIGGEAAIVLLRQALADSVGAIRETAALMLEELDATP